MVVKQFQDGGQPPFFKIDISPYLSEKSLDFHDIVYTAADFELGERHVIKNEKKFHWTDCEFDRTYFLLTI